MDIAKGRHYVKKTVDMALLTVHYILHPFSLLVRSCFRSGLDGKNERNKKIHWHGHIPITHILPLKREGGSVIVGEKACRNVHRIADSMGSTIVLYRRNEVLDNILYKGLYKAICSDFDPLRGLSNSERVDTIFGAVPDGSTITEKSRAFIRNLFIFLENIGWDASLYSILNINLFDVKEKMIKYAQDHEDKEMLSAVRGLGQEISVLKEYLDSCADALSYILAPDGNWISFDECDDRKMYIDLDELGIAKGIFIRSVFYSTNSMIILNNISVDEVGIDRLLQEHISRVVIVTNDVLEICGSEERAKAFLQKATNVVMFQQTAFSAALWSAFWGHYKHLEEQVAPIKRTLFFTSPQGEEKTKVTIVESLKPRLDISDLMLMPYNAFYLQYRNWRGAIVTKTGRAY